MQHEIKKYPVQHPLLKNYIRFFWEIHIDHALLNHKLIPQRNINLRFNLNETPQYLCLNGREHLLEDVFFSGLQDHYSDSHLKISGRIDTLGICFMPDGFYPLLKIPVSEFKNQVLGTGEAGFTPAKRISEQLREAPDAASRLAVLEKELVLLLNNDISTHENFRLLYNSLNRSSGLVPVSEFCRQNDISPRKLERMYNKYVGIPAVTYITLDRFHISLNQLLHQDYSKLSDIAFGNGYYDQMHFIKEFRRFTGNTPKNFITQNNSILNIGKLT